MNKFNLVEGARNPIKIWSDIGQVEAVAINQLRNTANLPFVFKHVAAMPDVHFGKGATVGSVVATRGAICPAAVGVDIGCGMTAVRTNIPAPMALDHLRELRAAIERTVPVGRESNRKVRPSVAAWRGWQAWDSRNAYGSALKAKAQAQLGSLGGGNHFIEVCLDKDNGVWVLLHSGSRNVGKTMAEAHIGRAKSHLGRLAAQLPDPDLAHFVEGTREYDNYLSDLLWCQDYAYQNRVEMMERVLKNLADVCNRGEPVSREITVSCHHNYASREIHYGEDVLVTRKGAVRARKGELGIIPGSMGARSFIVRGLGNPESFESCSHGAGRRMSRGEAKRRFTVEDLRRETAGVECRKDEGVLDEIPSAYKDIDEVMRNQSDLVEVVAELKQVLCVKG